MLIHWSKKALRKGNSSTSLSQDLPGAAIERTERVNMSSGGNSGRNVNPFATIEVREKGREGIRNKGRK